MAFRCFSPLLPLFSLRAQSCNSLHTVGSVIPRIGSIPVYLVAQAFLDRLSAISFPWIPQCSGVRTSRTLLYVDRYGVLKNVQLFWATLYNMWSVWSYGMKDPMSSKMKDDAWHEFTNVFHRSLLQFSDNTIIHPKFKFLLQTICTATWVFGKFNLKWHTCTLISRGLPNHNARQLVLHSPFSHQVISTDTACSCSPSVATRLLVCVGSQRSPNLWLSNHT